MEVWRGRLLLSNYFNFEYIRNENYHFFIEIKGVHL